MMSLITFNISSFLYICKKTDVINTQQQQKVIIQTDVKGYTQRLKTDVKTDVYMVKKLYTFDISYSPLCVKVFYIG